MIILVIGKTGQLARALIEYAEVHPDLKVTAAGRDEADLEVEGAAAQVISQSPADMIINAAAYTAVDQAEDEPDRAFRINAEAAGEIAAAVAASGKRLIHLSTDYVFDGASDEPYREDSPTNPLGVYGKSKLAGEEAVRAGLPTATIIRTAWVFSPFGRNFVKTMMSLGDERDRVTVVADQRGSPTSAIELAGALLKMCRRADGMRGQTFHLAGRGVASWFDVATQVMAEREKHGLRVAFVDPITTTDWPTRAPRPANSILNCGAIEEALGIRLPDWRLSVADTVARIARNTGL